MDNEPTLRKDPSADEFTPIVFTVGDRLRKLRTQNGMSSEQLAHALGVNRNTVMNYELDRIRELSPAILLHWCVQTGGKPSEIMGDLYSHLDQPALEKIREIRQMRQDALTQRPPVSESIDSELKNIPARAS